MKTIVTASRNEDDLVVNATVPIGAIDKEIIQSINKNHGYKAFAISKHLAEVIVEDTDLNIEMDDLVYVVLPIVEQMIKEIGEVEEGTDEQ